MTGGSGRHFEKLLDLALERAIAPVDDPENADTEWIIGEAGATLKQILD